MASLVKTSILYQPLMKCMEFRGAATGYVRTNIFDWYRETQGGDYDIYFDDGYIIVDWTELVAPTDAYAVVLTAKATMACGIDSSASGSSIITSGNPVLTTHSKTFSSSSTSIENKIYVIEATSDSKYGLPTRSNKTYIIPEEDLDSASNIIINPGKKYYAVIPNPAVLDSTYSSKSSQYYFMAIELTATYTTQDTQRGLFMRDTDTTVNKTVPFTKVYVSVEENEYETVTDTVMGSVTSRSSFTASYEGTSCYVGTGTFTVSGNFASLESCSVVSGGTVISGSVSGSVQSDGSLKFTLGGGIPVTSRAASTIHMGTLYFTYTAKKIVTRAEQKEVMDIYIGNTIVWGKNLLQLIPNTIYKTVTKKNGAYVGDAFAFQIYGGTAPYSISSYSLSEEWFGTNPTPFIDSGYLVLETQYHNPYDVGVQGGGSITISDSAGHTARASIIIEAV